MLNMVDYAKKENLYHALLINTKQITTGSDKSNKEFRELLKIHKTFEKIYMSLSLRLFDDKNEQNEVNKLEKILEKTPKFKILTINDPQFPEELKKREELTPVIYYQGNISLLDKKTIAVVGTREPKQTSQFLLESDNIIKRLTNKEYAIISGLAGGCDKIAHQKTILNKGKTIAVLGTPLNKYYPKENKLLQQILSKDHLLISQYPIGIKTWPQHFIFRDKTISALSKEGVVIMQAGDKSGALYALKESLKEEKQIYVLKNNLNLENEWVDKYKDKVKFVGVK